MSRLHIASKSKAPFRDRADAGRQLALEVQPLNPVHPVVLAIPRGGVPLAIALAQAFDGDVDVIMTHKIGAPGYDELAIGAVTESGKIFVEPQGPGGVDPWYWRTETARQVEKLKQRLSAYRAYLPEVSLKDREVIVVDDGMATGFTMKAALWAVRQQEPSRLIAAVPVASEDAVVAVSGLADALVCLRVPAAFAAVGAFYQDFRPVEDEAILRDFCRSVHARVRRSSAPAQRGGPADAAYSRRSG